MTTFITCFLVLYWHNNWITGLCKILGLFLSISISTINIQLLCSSCGPMLQKTEISMTQFEL